MIVAAILELLGCWFGAGLVGDLELLEKKHFNFFNHD